MSTQTLAEFTPYEIPAPIAAQVLAAAGQVCQCTGACGRLDEHGVNWVSGLAEDPRYTCQWAGKPGHRRLLVAAPVDPGTPEHAIWRIPTGELAAWCTHCWWNGRNKAQRTRADDLRQAQEALFPLPGGERPRYAPITPGFFAERGITFTNNTSGSTR